MIGRALLGCALVACGGDGARVTAVSLPTPLPSPPADTSPPSLPALRSALDAADFSSERGAVHLARDPGGTAAGSFGAGGVMSCSISGDQFACHWYESSTEGRATFRRKSDGRLEGTWGNATSDDDGGAWTLVPVGTTGLEGMWDTNFGVAVIRATALGYHVDYRDGTMDCEPRGDALDCAWTEGASTGHAHLARESPRVLRGRWGSGASATDGGAWLFVRR